MARQPPVGLGLFIAEVSRSQSVDTTQSEGPLDEFTARRRDLYLTKHNNHTRQTFVPQAGFETAVPTNGRRQTPALDGVATRIGIVYFIPECYFCSCLMRASLCEFT